MSRRRITPDTRATQWTAIVDHLSLKQLRETMGDAYRTYRAKAEKVKRVSCSKVLHAMANRLIETCDELESTTTYFQGLALPRTELVKTLVNAHVVATQEFDHDSAEDIEDYLFDLARFDEMLGMITSTQIEKVRAAKAVQL